MFFQIGKENRERMEGLMKGIKRCPNSVSGKHRFSEYYDGAKKVTTTEELTLIITPKYIKKCDWCGLVNDADIKDFYTKEIEAILDSLRMEKKEIPVKPKKRGRPRKHGPGLTVTRTYPIWDGYNQAVKELNERIDKLKGGFTRIWEK